MRAVLSIMLAASLLLLFIASCKKKEDDHATTHTPGGPYCILADIVHPYNGGCKDSTVIQSADLGRISGLLTFNNCNWASVSHKRFVYEGAKVYIIDTASFSTQDTLITDTSLRILEWRSGNLSTGGQALHFEYNAAGEIQRTILSTQFGNSDTTLYKFSNGDLVMEMSAAGDTTRYTYFTDKTVPANNYIMQPGGVRFGSAYYVKNVHLVKSISYSRGGTIDRSYGFDSYGNVVRSIGIEAGSAALPDTTSYHYFCIVE